MKRIQRTRKKGFRLLPGSVYVGRPGIFGNPFDSVEFFRIWLESGKRRDKRRKELLSRLPELKGKDLACWCPLDQPCHADVLLELANPLP